MRFCGECGTQLPVTCVACGFDNPPNFKFCGACGSSLAQQPVPTAPAPAAKPANVTSASAVSTPVSSSAVITADPRHDRSDGERRQLTLLFCDLVESTALAERLDAEVYRDLVVSYQRACAEVISGFDGHIAQYLGDGLLVYFGYPYAHEDDARRAALAALGMLEAVRTLPLDARVRSIIPALAVRVGIHTGSVIAGDVGAGSTRERLALGSAPNIAARLQSISEPNGVLISGDTERLLKGWFDVESLGMHELRGVSKPVAVFRVVREARRNGRFEFDDAKRLSALVGRDEELALLMRRLQMSREGNGSIVLLSGEAGVGKSRLVQAARVRAVEEGFMCVVGRSASVHQNSALLPVADLLEGLIGFDPEEGAEQRLAHIESFVHELGLPGDDSVQLLASLLSTPLTGLYTPLSIGPQLQRARTSALLVQVLARSAERCPLVLVVEDLHWADPSTLEFLTMFVDQPPLPGLLAIFTVRRDFDIPWSSRSHVTQLTLSRLSDNDVRTMIAHMSGATALPAAIVAQVVQKTDGIPVFVEELTRMMLELGLVEGGNSVNPMALVHLIDVPETLQDSLLARLDRLGDAKDIAQIGAVLGRTFAHELLVAVAGYDEQSLQQHLARLVDAELLYQRGVAPSATYTFKHALIQEAAYSLLLRSNRRILHERVANALSAQFSSIVAAQPELLAHHLTEAGRTREAAEAWTNAGLFALGRSALAEAMSQLRRALELIATLPESSERDSMELKTLTTLGTIYASTRGYAAPETVEAYARCNALCEKLGEAKELFWVIAGLWVSAYVSGELRKALSLAQRLDRIAENGEIEMRMEAQYMLGATYRFMGELSLARTHLSNVHTLDYAGRVVHTRIYTALDSVVTSASIAAECFWLLDDPDGSDKMQRFAERESARLEHPLSMAITETSGAWLGVANGDRAEVAVRAKRTLDLSEQHGLFMAGYAAIYLGWVANNPAQISSVLQMVLMGGARLGVPHYYSLLAEAQWNVGDHDAALAALDAGEAMMDATSERYWDSAMMRLRGEILAAMNQFDEAKRALETAVKRAQDRGAPLLERRARESIRELLRKTEAGV